jgi:hypothetical protein
MTAPLHDSPLVDHQNQVGADDGAEAMGDHQAAATGQQSPVSPG